jgi:hypothetical protein
MVEEGIKGRISSCLFGNLRLVENGHHLQRIFILGTLWILAILFFSGALHKAKQPDLTPL